MRMKKFNEFKVDFQLKMTENQVYFFIFRI